MPPHYDLLVGTFNTPSLFTLRFIPPSRQSSDSQKGSLKILKQHEAIGSHSWLHLNPPLNSSDPTSIRTLYATAWTEPPTLAAYSVTSPTSIKLLNTARTNTRSGYVCASATHAYSAGGATGEVYQIDTWTGAFTSSSSSSSLSTSTNGVVIKGDTKTHKETDKSSSTPTQTLTFVTQTEQRDNGSTMDFGGLRHGAHSADLSPDGTLLYIADIGRNCIWVYSVASSTKESSSSTIMTPHLKLEQKMISPRSHDGPRHVHPHPNGMIVYCLQEHSSVVDVFEVVKDVSEQSAKVELVHRQGVRIIPQGLNVGDFWADEVRTSLTEVDGNTPKYLYASTRGLKEGKKGFVAIYRLRKNGLIEHAEMVGSSNSGEWRDDDQGGLLCMYETLTSGGWANAIQPGPTVDEVEYIAMTDSEVGYVFVLGWDGRELVEAARLDLNDAEETTRTGQESRHGAATAVWF